MIKYDYVNGIILDDQDPIFCCPKCKSYDGFMTKKRVWVCRMCWAKSDEEDATQYEFDTGDGF